MDTLGTEDKRNLAIIRSLRQQTLAGKLKWNSCPEVGYDGVSTAVNTQAAGRIVVEMDTNNRYNEEGFYLFFTSGDFGVRSIDVDRYRNPEIFGEAQNLFDSATATIEPQPGDALLKEHDGVRTLERGLDELVELSPLLG